MPFELKEAGHFELIIKKSQFITYVYPIQDKSEVNAVLHDLKQRYPDARHICYAFLVGNHSGMGDDGEPSGTAGKPMFSILQHNDLVNTLAVVVRYFGGIKLGAGGLIRAYGQAVNQCLDQCELVEQIKKTTFMVVCDFSFENKIRHYCSQMPFTILDCQYSEQLMMTINVPLTQSAEFNQQLIHLCAGSVVLSEIEKD
ncbi:YigZ family protein [Marinicellulosiphila megalodicopiae]|uniref:YigZ family protein n=1 Tax=Marinicellulosiphila megalodicopiae TaxID=2724896 RepID=UPI003BAFF89C